MYVFATSTLTTGYKNTSILVTTIYCDLVLKTYSGQTLKVVLCQCERWSALM